MSDLGESEFFFRSKPVLAVIALSGQKSDWYASSLAKEIDCTFPHIVKILARLEQLDVVSFRVEGRKKYVVLTSKGRQLADSFVKTVSCLK